YGVRRSVRRVSTGRTADPRPVPAGSAPSTAHGPASRDRPAIVGGRPSRALLFRGLTYTRGPLCSGSYKLLEGCHTCLGRADRRTRSSHGAVTNAKRNSRVWWAVPASSGTVRCDGWAPPPPSSQKSAR